MRKIMISQPMKGKTNEQIKKEREQLVKEIENNGDIVLDTVFDIEPEDVVAPIYCLSKSIEYLAQADAVFFMKGWEKARGCKIEHEVAIEYGKDVFYENSFETENSSNADKIKQLLKKIYKGGCENYIVIAPEEIAINGNFIDLITMVDYLIEELAKNMEISKEELCKLLSF